jgi:RimJ/RimL family protein N-acetyltransferase
MTPELQTPRLLLRPLELPNAAQTQVLFPHWDIVRYLNGIVPWPYPPDGALVFYRDIALPAVARGEAWHWTLRLKNDPERVIGSINLTKGNDNNRGFWLGIPWHGQGLMSEACEVVTEYWFETLNFPLLRVPKAVANTASRRISLRQGMRIVGTEARDYVSGRHPSEIWEITQQEWRDRKVRIEKQGISELG